MEGRFIYLLHEKWEYGEIFFTFTWKVESMVEKNPKELSKHARLLGTSEYDGIVFF